MPPVPTPNHEFMFGKFANWEMRLSALEVQQQSIISNLQGQPVVATGLSPGSNPAQYGIQLLSQAFGSEVSFFGEDSTGNVALTFRDSAGNIITRNDQVGLTVYDDTGTVQMQAGLVNASPAIYGVVVRAPGGSMQLVGGVETSAAGALSNTTVTTWTVPTGASTVTATIGPSGSAKIEISGQASTGTNGQVASIGCQVDGSTVPVSTFVSSGAGGVSAGISKVKVITGLTPGSHTFEAVVETAANGSSNCSFSDVTVTVTPL